MKRETVTLVGRAHDLSIENGAARWQVTIRQGSGQVADFTLQASAPAVLEQVERMAEGALIGLIATLPSKRQCVPGAALTVTRLEILGKPQAA